MAKTIADRVCEVLQSVLSMPQTYDRQAKLDSFGLDSLDLTEIVHEIETEFDIMVDESDTNKIANGTINDLIEYVEVRLS